MVIHILVNHSKMAPPSQTSFRSSFPFIQQRQPLINQIHQSLRTTLLISSHGTLAQNMEEYISKNNIVISNRVTRSQLMNKINQINSFFLLLMYSSIRGYVAGGTTFLKRLISLHYSSYLHIKQQIRVVKLLNDPYFSNKKNNTKTKKTDTTQLFVPNLQRLAPRSMLIHPPFTQDWRHLVNFNPPLLKGLAPRSSSHYLSVLCLRCTLKNQGFLKRLTPPCEIAIS